MGLLAERALVAGGEVIGVIPRDLFAREVPHRRVTRLIEVDSMHERKARMADLADAFVALPGGVGTLEELFEVWTWAQLGLHGKPIGLVDVAGFWAPAAALLDRAGADGFLAAEVRSSIAVAPTPAEALDAFATWERPALGKWTEKDVTL